MFNHLQDTGTSNYDYELLENEITEGRNNGITDKITKPVEEVLNFPEDDVDITSENYDISRLNTQSSKLMKETTQHLP